MTERVYATGNETDIKIIYMGDDELESSERLLRQPVAYASCFKSAAS
jgi:hypothetical protein